MLFDRLENDEVIRLTEDKNVVNVLVDKVRRLLLMDD